jgi:hypothetical protein
MTKPSDAKLVSSGTISFWIKPWTRTFVSRLMMKKQNHNEEIDDVLVVFVFVFVVIVVFCGMFSLLSLISTCTVLTLVNNVDGSARFLAVNF